MLAFDRAGHLLDPDAAAAPIDTREVLHELDEPPADDIPISKVIDPGA